jgi:hypothetical protein
LQALEQQGPRGVSEGGGCVHEFATDLPWVAPFKVQDIPFEGFRSTMACALIIRQDFVALPRVGAPGELSEQRVEARFFESEGDVNELLMLWCREDAAL